MLSDRCLCLSVCLSVCPVRLSVTFVHCDQTATRIKMKLGMQVGMMSLGMELGLGPGNFVLDGDPAPPPQKGGGAPKFSAHVHCGQTAGWIKMKQTGQTDSGPTAYIGRIVLQTVAQKRLNRAQPFLHSSSQREPIEMPFGLRLRVCLTLDGIQIPMGWGNYMGQEGRCKV